MIREFIRCQDRLERIRFLESTDLKDWDTKELDQVMCICGLEKLNVGLTDQQKFLTIYSHIMKRKIA